MPLVRHAVDVASDACHPNTVLVLGHDWRAVADACMPLQGFIVVNERHAEGLGSSIARAARSLRHVADAVIVLLADQPLVSAAHVRALRDTWGGADDEIVATAYAATVGVPALFASGCFDDLANLQGDAGARRLMTDERFHVRKINFEAAAVDVDTRADLNGLCGRDRDVVHRK